MVVAVVVVAAADVVVAAAAVVVVAADVVVAVAIVVVAVAAVAAFTNTAQDICQKSPGFYFLPLLFLFCSWQKLISSPGTWTKGSN